MIEIIKFIVRLELNDSQETDYNELHEIMEKAGFLRTITYFDDKKYVFKLPHAEYLYEITYDPNKDENEINEYNVLGHVEDTLNDLDEELRIMVVKANGIAFKGLEEV